MAGRGAMLPSIVLHLLCLSTFLLAEELKPTRWPLYTQKPLLLAWNAPTEGCAPRHRVTFQFHLFQIVAYPTEGFVRQNLTIFYKERLGLYPYYDSDGTAKNGGIPQRAFLRQHVDKIPADLDKYIKANTKGLAVLDWEEWRPLWIRNWNAKNIYREQSKELIKKMNPSWTQEQVAKVAQQEFELSARKFMQDTLRLVKSLRPDQLWGFYLFPDCYNHDYTSNNGMKNYTGRCPDLEVDRNDQLRWLWTESTALFPSVYLGQKLKDRTIGRQFVRNRVREGMRLASIGNGTARPVFIYARPTYINELALLTEMDLVSTIGESVSLGAAGVILWGDSTYASNNTSCSTLSTYLHTGALGRYLLNVSSAAEQCSARLCGWRGRCLRIHPNTDTYLHLSPRTHTLQLQDGRLVVRGQMDNEDLKQLRQTFQCQCYTGYKGTECSQRAAGSRVAPTGTAVLGLLLVLTLSFLH